MILKRKLHVIYITISSIYSRDNNRIISIVNGYISNAICGTSVVHTDELFPSVNNGMMELFQNILLLSLASDGTL